MKSLLFPILTFTPLTTAHFILNYPPSRGSNEETMGTFPCGGFTTPSSSRTQIPISSDSSSSSSFPIALDMGHDQTAVEFLLALGTDPDTNYNITLRKTFRVEGLGEFCDPHVVLDADVLGTGVELVDGLNATLQVQTNADPNGGLYACADLQLTTSRVPPPPSTVCRNNTGVRAIPFSGAAAERSANVSTPDGGPQSGSDSGSDSDSHSHSDHDHDHGSGTGGADSSSETGAAVALETSAWGVVGAVVVVGLVGLGSV
ncbi:putative GPI anchored protein [Aspergillus lucknowensis]|uniref:Copper acquisition factor BIM1-like domain-containing protein n=1 Tax=Aspergillus lucknowensis TaxID=176173 RepID=A0ABR4M4I6_9EURO